jgi:hypothetical protein
MKAVVMISGVEDRWWSNGLDRLVVRLGYGEKSVVA